MNTGIKSMCSFLSLPDILGSPVGSWLHDHIQVLSLSSSIWNVKYHISKIYVKIEQESYVQGLRNSETMV